MRLGLYARVSTDTQAKGESLADQKHDGREWAEVHGHTVAVSYVDAGLSGRLPADERPGLASALEALETGAIDGLVIRDLDRLARELTVQEAVLATVWARLDTVVYEYAAGREVLRDDPDDPMRTAMRQMAGVFAQLNRAMTVKKLRDGRRNKERRGGHANGPAPYGWKSVDGDLVPLPDELALVRRTVDLAAEGLTQTEVAARLNAEGHRTREDALWSQQVVSRILRREATLTPAQRAYQAERLATSA